MNRHIEECISANVVRRYTTDTKWLPRYTNTLAVEWHKFLNFKLDAGPFLVVDPYFECGSRTLDSQWLYTVLVHTSFSQRDFLVKFDNAVSARRRGKILTKPWLQYVGEIAYER